MWLVTDKLKRQWSTKEAVSLWFAQPFLITNEKRGNNRNEERRLKQQERGKEEEATEMRKRGGNSSASLVILQVTKCFLNENKRMKGWNPKKPIKLDGNDATTLSHHPYKM